MKRERISRAEMDTAPRGPSMPFPYGSVRTVSLLPPKGAVVVSKKTFNTAVRRNRIRRRIREITARAIREGVLKKSVIIYPNVHAEKATFNELTAALRELFSRLRSATMPR